MQACDLADTDRLLDLYRQAVEAKLAHRSEHGRLEFFSLAERARTRGRRAGALFYWLLRENKTEFITLSDEDEAARRLRQHMNRSDPPLPAKSPLKPTDSNSEKMTAGERFVVACLRVARQHRIDDPFIVARQAREWTRDQWEEAHHAHLQSQQARWYGAADAEL